MAIRIEFTMVNGEVFTLSRNSYGKTGPLVDISEAQAQLSMLTEKCRYFGTDQGAVIFTAQIASAKIRNDIGTKSRGSTVDEGAVPAKSTCSCCGREFEERLRIRDRAGETWSGVLERYKKEGVCPLCYNTFGFVHNYVKMWSDEIWNAFINDKLKNIEDPQALKEVEAAAQRKDPDLAGRVRHKLAELQAAKKSSNEARRKREAIETEYARLATKDEFDAFATKYRQEFPDLAELAVTGFEKMEAQRLDAAERQRSLVEKELQEANSFSTVSVFIDKYASTYPDLVRIAKTRRVSLREKEHEDQLRFQHGPRYGKCASCVYLEYKVGVLGGETLSCQLGYKNIKSPTSDGCAQYRVIE